MKEKIDKRTWSEEDIACLSLGHTLGASLKTLSIVLNRSESALNKALSRLGIRQYGRRSESAKLRKSGSLRITPAKLRLEINNYFSQKKNYMDSKLFSLSPKRVKKKYTLPNAFLSSPPNIVKCKRISPALWVNIDYALIILKKRGHNVYRFSKDHTNFKDSEAWFYLDGKPKTAAQILVYANKVRENSGLEPFYVEAITEH